MKGRYQSRKRAVAFIKLEINESLLVVVVVRLVLVVVVVIILKLKAKGGYTNTY